MTIKEARVAAGLTQKEMSRIMGIPKRNIENWESENKSNPPAWAEKLILKELKEKAAEL
jgi:DNA-binding transcriptional regulator YiaG